MNHQGCMKLRPHIVLATMCWLGMVPAALAQEDASAARPMVSYSTYGTPGIIDMPTAHMARDAELATSISTIDGNTRFAMTFQIAPRLTGTFRYSRIDPWDPATGSDTFDRSFDLRYQVLTETENRPAVAIGIQDFVGTGIYSGEYVVASKHFGSRWSVTGGIGWGRFGSYNGFTNPLGIFDSAFETRPSGIDNTGGQLETGRWFRGDAALFAGVTYQATDRLLLKAEYSSDAYVEEERRGAFNHRSPLNFGLQYRLSDGVETQLYYLNGSEIGAAITIRFNPKGSVVNGSVGGGAIPVQVRAPGAAADLGWTTQADGPAVLRDNVQTLLSDQALVLEAMEISAQSVTVRVENNRTLAAAEAIGRTARVLSATMPASVERFVIVPVINGLPASAIVLLRSDIEELEFDPDGATKSFERAEIIDAPPIGAHSVYREGAYPRFSWGIGPYVRASAFDPDDPLLADMGLQFNAEYVISPGLILSGSVQHRLVGNLDSSDRVSDSVLPRVRSETNIYNREGETALTDLTLAYYFRPGQDLYGRVTAGYLERHFGGVSAELLWKPVDSRLALGAEINHVRQRAFDQDFDFREYEVTTGHVSAYYDLSNGYHGQLDVGRYLAGDWGATISVDREFKNGWRVGAYATFTDVSAEDFGEGSFDKGIRLTVPLETILGQQTNKRYEVSIQPLTRDGGARLEVEGRLYDTVRSYHTPELQEGWGRFWR